MLDTGIETKTRIFVRVENNGIRNKTCRSSPSWVDGVEGAVRSVKSTLQTNQRRARMTMFTKDMIEQDLQKHFNTEEHLTYLFNPVYGDGTPDGKHYFRFGKRQCSVTSEDMKSSMGVFVDKLIKKFLETA